MLNADVNEQYHVTYWRTSVWNTDAYLQKTHDHHVIIIGEV